MRFQSKKEKKAKGVEGVAVRTIFGGGGKNVLSQL